MSGDNEYEDSMNYVVMSDDEALILSEGVSVVFQARQVLEPENQTVEPRNKYLSDESLSDEFETKSELERVWVDAVLTSKGYGDEPSWPKGGMLTNSPPSILDQGEIPKIQHLYKIPKLFDIRAPTEYERVDWVVSG